MIQKRGPHYQALYAKASELHELVQQELEVAIKERETRSPEVNPADVEADIQQLTAAEEALRHTLAFLVSSDAT